MLDIRKQEISTEIKQELVNRLWQRGNLRMCRIIEKCGVYTDKLCGDAPSSKPYPRA